MPKEADLPRNELAAGWLLADMALNIWALSIIKALGLEYPAFQLVFLRASVGLVLMLPWIWWHRDSFRDLPNLGLHALRVGFSAVALTASFFAISRLPLALFTAISFTRPILTMIAAAWLLKEIITRDRWIAAIVGLVGVVIAVDPSVLSGGWGLAAQILVVFVATGAVITTRKLIAAPTIVTGVISPGIGSVTLGTAGVVICSFDEPPLDPNGAIPAEIHCYPGKYICEGLQTTAGAALKWLRNMAQDATQGTEVEYNLFNEMAAKASPGSDGLLFLPYLAGAGAPQWNGAATGTFHGLTQGHGLGAMARAVMEGVAFQNALILKEFEKTGRDLSEVRLTGGGAQSPLWSQIQADIYGRPVKRLKEDEAGLLGAAILAAVGAGLFDTIDTGVAQMVKTLETYEPNLESEAAYSQMLEQFSGLYERLYN